MRRVRDMRHMTRSDEALRGFGAEELRKMLNGYFEQLIRFISDSGGDVLRIAGDAVIAVFSPDAKGHEEEGVPDSEGLLVTEPSPNGESQLPGIATASLKCACDLVTHLNNWQVPGSSHTLKLHVGVGAGPLHGFHVGGEQGRWEYVVTGPAFAQISSALDAAPAGRVGVSQPAWEHVLRHNGGQVPAFAADYAVQAGTKDVVVTPPPRPAEGAREQLPEGLSRTAELLEATEGASRWTEEALRAYVPVTVLTHQEAATTEWIGEVRRVSVFFLMLKTRALSNPDRSALRLLQRTYCFIQRALYRREGVIKEFTVDDKGCVVVAGFGMPPYVHDDDSVRAVQAAQEVMGFLRANGSDARIGISTGTVFCAWVGSEVWRDFAMIGQTVNMSARLMANKGNRDILVDAVTFARSKQSVSYHTLEPIFVKGRASPMGVFRPLPEREARRLRRRDIFAAPFLGQHRAQAAMRAQVRRLVDTGGGGFCLALGDVGCGKTALLEVGTPRPARDTRACGAYGRPPPLNPLPLPQRMMAAARELGVVALQTQASRVHTSTPLHPWRGILVPLLELEVERRDPRALMRYCMRVPEVRSAVPQPQREGALTPTGSPPLSPSPLLSLAYAHARRRGGGGP